MNAAVRMLGPDGLELAIVETLTPEDFRQFRELAEERIDRYGNVNLLIDITHFSNWTPTALWSGLKLDVARFNDVGRLAIVGATPDDSWVAALAEAFTGARIHYYAEADIEAAREWIRDIPLEKLSRMAWSGAEPGHPVSRG